VEAGILPASERGFQPRDPFAVVRVSKLRPMKKSWENSFCASAGNGLISRRIFHTFGHV
jgi:hypothetical protein